jgi:UDP-N-acetyl-2-amino-2-deoxyglucuronate dehydrogenase
VFAKGINALADIEAEDTAAVILKFRNGAIGIIEATTAIRPKDLEGSLSILGAKGSVEIGGFAVNKMLHWNFNESIAGDDEVMEKYSVNPPSVYGFGHHAYYDHVVESIVEQKPHMVDGLQGRKSVELISAIYESMETRKEVFLRLSPEHCKLGERL